MKVRFGDLLIVSLSVGVLWVAMLSRETTPVVVEPETVQAAPIDDPATVQRLKDTLESSKNNLARIELMNEEMDRKWGPVLGSNKFSRARDTAVETSNHVLLVFRDLARAKQLFGHRYVICDVPASEPWDATQTTSERFSTDAPWLLYDMSTQAWANPQPELE